MSKYYYLIASLPELNLEDSKLSFTIADFKEELYENLSGSDKKLIDLFYLKFDNENLLHLLKNKEAEIDPRGNYTAEELLNLISAVKAEEKISSKDFPSYMPVFISDYFKESSLEEDSSMLSEDKLAALYYEYGMKCSNEFISSWFKFNFIINNVLIALTARKYKMDIAPYIVGNMEVTDALKTSGARDFGLTNEIDFFDQIVKISEIDELLEREWKLDFLRWDWMEDATFFNYFGVECVFAYLIKLEMIERWISLDKEKGKELFREIIDALKDEVQIPSEFK
jgi:Protein of unknown function (DUF2764).